MALQSVLQCVPTALHSTMSIYRVKPRNEYTPAGEVLYKRTRYVIIYQEGFALCTCLLGRHLGIPCSHFFAVMQRFPEKHGFNIAQVHQKWHNPFGRERCLDRPWIYLETGNDNILPKNEDDFMSHQRKQHSKILDQSEARRKDKGITIAHPIRVEIRCEQVRGPRCSNIYILRLDKAVPPALARKNMLRWLVSWKSS